VTKVIDKSQVQQRDETPVNISRSSFKITFEVFVVNQIADQAIISWKILNNVRKSHAVISIRLMDSAV